MLTGPTSSFRRVGKADPALEILFCLICAGVLAWRGLPLEEDGRRRVTVNARLADLRPSRIFPSIISMGSIA